MNQENIKKFINTVGVYSERVFAPYGLFQIIWIALAIICCIFAFKLCYKKHLQRYYVSVGIFMLATLFYKLIVLCLKDGKFNLDLKNLPISAFDIPVFTILLSGIFIKGKFHVILSAFNASFGFLLGAFALLFPFTATTQFIGVSVQIKLNALLTLTIATVNLKSHAKTFNVVDFLISASGFMLALVIVESVKIILSTFANVDFLCFFSYYFTPDKAVFSHLLTAFPHALASFILALLFAELSAGIYYLAFKLSTKKRRYK